MNLTTDTLHSGREIQGLTHKYTSFFFNFCKVAETIWEANNEILCCDLFFNSIYQYGIK